MLTVLGCSGSMSGPDSPASGYLLTADGNRLVLDLGNGTLGPLQRFATPFQIDALAFSHLHADHCADVPTLAVHLRYHPDPPDDATPRPLPVHAPSGAADRFAALYAVDDTELAETDLSDVFAFHPLPAEPTDVVGFTVTAARVDHPCEAYGIRVERDGRSLCYTGDSGPCEALVRLADGVDTLLSEASWTDRSDREQHLHMSGRQAGELAAKAGVGRLVVTHVMPWTDKTAVLAEARSAFPGDIVLAESGAEYQI